MMNIKIILIAVLGVLLMNCNAQDQEVSQYQPKAYNTQEITSSYNSYKSKARDITSYLPKRHKKDGTADYTKYLQKGLDENKIVLLPNFPILINDSGLKLSSNSVVLFNENSKLILKASAKDTYDMLQIHHKQNVKVFNANLKGDITTHKGKDGEWGMGIAIRSSENVYIYNPKIENCWGDGIYVGFVWDKPNKKLYDESKNVEIYNAFINNNGRNGLSIVAVDGLKVYNSLFANQRRTFPKAGIDIEPGPKLTQNIILKNNVTYKNGARGIDVFLRTIAKNRVNTTSAQIINHKDVASPIGIRIAGYADRDNMHPVDGNIRIENPSLTNNRLNTILIEKDQRHMPNIEIVSEDEDLHQMLNKAQARKLKILK